MDKITALCQLLEEKKEKLLAYEVATLALLQCDADDAEHYIIQRGEIANEVDALGEEMARLCDGEPARQLMLDAANVRVDFSGVPSEYQCIYYAGQAVRSVASRIMESDKQVMERLQALRDEAREMLRQNENLPKIKQYLSNLGDKPTELGLTDEKA